MGNEYFFFILFVNEENFMVWLFGNRCKDCYLYGVLGVIFIVFFLGLGREGDRVN